MILYYLFYTNLMILYSLFHTNLMFYTLFYNQTYGFILFVVYQPYDFKLCFITIWWLVLCYKETDFGDEAIIFTKYFFKH